MKVDWKWAVIRFPVGIKDPPKDYMTGTKVEYGWSHDVEEAALFPNETEANDVRAARHESSQGFLYFTQRITIFEA